MDIPQEMDEAVKKMIFAASEISWTPIRLKKIVPIVAI